MTTSQIPLIRLRAAFMWWWVFALATNFILIVLLSHPVNNALNWFGKHGGDWMATACTDAFGEFGCLILVLAVFWWLFLIALILGLLLKLFFYLAPFISPIISLAMAIRVLNAFKPNDSPLLSHLRWYDFVGAVLSLPFSWIIFVYVLQFPESPIFPAEIVKSRLPIILENLWFIVLGAVGWLLTWITLGLVNTRKLSGQPISEYVPKVDETVICPVCHTSNPISAIHCSQCEVNLDKASRLR